MPKFTQQTIDSIEHLHPYDLVVRMGHWTKRSGANVTIRCPNQNHYEKTPDTCIYMNHGIFKCYGGGGCGAKGGALQYYAWSTWGCWDPKTQFVDAVIGVCELMGYPIEYEGSTPPSSTLRPQQPAATPATAARAVFEEIPAQSAEVCDRVYRRFLQLCPIYREHAEEWMTKRKYTKDQITAFGLRSIPATWQENKLIVETLLKEGYALDEIPGFHKKLRKNGNPLNDKDWYWTINAYGKYFLPVRDDSGHVVRLRMATGNEKKKYTWFSSSPNVVVMRSASGQITEIKPMNPSMDIQANAHELSRCGASSSHHINVVLPYQQLASWEPGDEITDIFWFDKIVVTEGEHKSFISANILNMPVVGVPGVGNYRDVLPALKRWGVKKVIVAYDADAFVAKEKDGKKTKNEEVFKNLINFAKEIMDSDGIELVFWIWNIADGKGLDDVLMSGKLPIEVDPRTKARTPVAI